MRHWSLLWRDGDDCCLAAARQTLRTTTTTQHSATLTRLATLQRYCGPSEFVFEFGFGCCHCCSRYGCCCVVTAPYLFSLPRCVVAIALSVLPSLISLVRACDLLLLLLVTCNIVVAIAMCGTWSYSRRQIATTVRLGGAGLACVCVCVYICAYVCGFCVKLGITGSRDCGWLLFVSVVYHHVDVAFVL